LIEPINYYDIPGFYLNRTEQAVRILDDVGADNAFVQYDIYHAQRMEGELAATAQKYWRASDYMQPCDNPDATNRHRRSQLSFLFAHLDQDRLQGLDRLRITSAHNTERGLAGANASRIVQSRIRRCPDPRARRVKSPCSGMTMREALAPAKARFVLVSGLYSQPIQPL